MISSKDRSHYIGASDTSMVVGNWTTATYRKWWQEKIGTIYPPQYDNKYTLAGTFYEHAILDTIPMCDKDNQVVIEDLNLRVNYDGMVGNHIYEVKTFKEEKGFEVSKAYWRQAQVEMYVAGSRELHIVAYPMTDEHYKNYFLEIEEDKIQYHKVEYDENFIREYLGKLLYLKSCMDEGRFPLKEEYEQCIKRKEAEQQISQWLSRRPSGNEMRVGVSYAAIDIM